jgi:hypothetical protein
MFWVRIAAAGLGIVAFVPVALAQAPQDFFSTFQNAMRNAVQIETVREAWYRLPSPEIACVDQRLRARGYSLKWIVNHGIGPTDPRSLELRSNCRVASSNVPLNSSPTYYYVANTLPPDPFLALRSDPSASVGRRLMKLRNGTPLEVMRKNEDGWWYVRVAPTGEVGWAFSGRQDKKWILCCVDQSGTVQTEARITPQQSSDENPLESAKGDAEAARKTIEESKLKLEAAEAQRAAAEAERQAAAKSAEEAVAAEKQTIVARFTEFKTRSVDPADKLARLLNYSNFGSNSGGPDGSFWASKDKATRTYAKFRQGSSLQEPVETVDVLDVSQLNPATLYVRGEGSDAVIVAKDRVLFRCRGCDKNELKERWIEYFLESKT